MTKTEIKNLEKRLSALRSTANSDDARQQEVYYRVIAPLSGEERAALARAIKDAEEAGKNPDDETWLASRPENEQRIVRKVAACFKTFEQQLQEEVRKLEADPELRRREGITEEMEKEWQD